MVVVWLFLAVPCVCLHYVIVEFPDHTHLLFLKADFGRLFLSGRLRQVLVYIFSFKHVQDITRTRYCVL